MNWLTGLVEAKVTIAGTDILWREIIGNAFGLASVLFGMRRSIWTWPVGMVGNVLLFTVLLGGVFHSPQALDLWGQAGRQIFFFAVSVYGLWRWRQSKTQHEASDGGAIVPRWATWTERAGLIGAAIVLTVVFRFVLGALNSWNPWPDAWILTGSILATYGMARGWVEFWLIWIAVDAVGVPLLLQAGYYPTALMYVIYAAFVVLGFVTWARLRRRLERELRTAAEAATRSGSGAGATADPVG